MRRFLTAAEEHDLVVMAQAGDLAARDRVIENLMPMLHKEAVKIVRKHQHPHVDADDLVQEAVLKIVSVFGNYDPNMGFRLSSYVLRGCRQTMLRAALDNGVISGYSNFEHLKPRSRDQFIQAAGPLLSLLTTRDESTGAVLIDLLRDTRVSSEDADSRELVQAVRESVARIPDRYRQLITWKFLEDETFVEIAKRLGLTTSRVQQLASEAIRWVKRILLSNPAIRDYVLEYGDPRTATYSHTD